VKIDTFCHIMPRPYYDIAAPPVEDLGSPRISKEMSRISNESMAELVRSHPDRFAGFMACVPMDDPEAAVAELEYATKEMGALGAQIYTHVHGRPMDGASFDPFYATAARLGSVIQVHPCRSSAWADYPTEERSRYEVWWTFGWEYDLSAFMARIVFSGVLERYPELKLLIHHGSSMVPHFAGRVGPGWDQLGARTPPERREDTAMFGAAHALRCSIDFYGASHILFGSDSPYDPERGPGYIRATIKTSRKSACPRRKSRRSSAVTSSGSPGSR
jgi:predicted TIM-barrel fold metal-dependent hydrolase